MDGLRKGEIMFKREEIEGKMRVGTGGLVLDQGIWIVESSSGMKRLGHIRISHCSEKIDNHPSRNS